MAPSKWRTWAERVGGRALGDFQAYGAAIPWADGLMATAWGPAAGMKQQGTSAVALCALLDSSIAGSPLGA